MPIITRIDQQKKRANRRSVYLDGKFSFGCSENVVARFRLRVGMEVTAVGLREIEAGEIRQGCLDKAFNLLSRRMQSKAELRTKLKRGEFSAALIEEVIQQLAGMGYLDDLKFAVAKTSAGARHKSHGPRRARVELIRSGIKSDVAARAIKEVYAETDLTALARGFARRQAARLRGLEPAVARRRLTATLMRRGFDYATIGSVIVEILGSEILREKSRGIRGK